MLKGENILEHEKRSVWVDYIRVIASFSVILLHSTAPLIFKYGDLPLTHWMIGNIYDSAVRMCVPLFFMISGYLLLDKNESLVSFYKKRFNKIVPPLIAWSFFYVLWTA
jgi:surface polysaccharide O-acyltransferase-like enzyme